MQNATILGVVQSVERHRRTVHIGVFSDDYGLVSLILKKGQCPSNLLKEGKEVLLFGVKAAEDKFTARKILAPSLASSIKKRVETGRNFFNTQRFKFAPRFAQ